MDWTFGLEGWQLIAAAIAAASASVPGLWLVRVILFGALSATARALAWALVPKKWRVAAREARALDEVLIPLPRRPVSVTDNSPPLEESKVCELAELWDAHDALKAKHDERESRIEALERRGTGRSVPIDNLEKRVKWLEAQSACMRDGKRIDAVEKLVNGELIDRIEGLVHEAQKRPGPDERFDQRIEELEEQHGTSAKQFAGLARKVEEIQVHVDQVSASAVHKLKREVARLDEYVNTHLKEHPGLLHALQEYARAVAKEVAAERHKFIDDLPPMTPLEAMRLVCERAQATERLGLKAHRKIGQLDGELASVTRRTSDLEERVRDIDGNYPTEPEREDGDPTEPLSLEEAAEHLATASKEASVSVEEAVKRILGHFKGDRPV